VGIIMDFLLHNLIADMPGRTFIWVALAYCVFLIIIVKFWVNSTDSTRTQPVPSIDPSADPYEIAYLQAGEKEVAVTALFTLLQQGYLVPSEKGRVGPGEKVPDLSYDLVAIEKMIYEHCQTPQPAGQLLFSAQLQSRLASQCEIYRQQLIRKGMLMPDSDGQMAWYKVLAGTMMMEMPLIYKLMVALAKGKTNVIFLMLMLFVGPIALFAICKPERMTSLGRRYLAQFKKELLSKKHQLADAPAHSEAVLMVALFGAGVLAGTSYDFFKDLFPRSTSGGSCSSGSSCSSSSCGSSCSSCGGGGCGGCGGD
jgi:uncharacterized protein (TIGR04222 family)